MTYLQFHLAFLLPPLLVLAVARWGRPGRVPEPARLGPALAAMVAVALVYTTPWDNLLVANGVWGYPPDRVLFSILYVPFEEYLFFVLQTLLSGLALAAVWPLLPARGDGGAVGTRWLGAATFLAIAVAGGLLLTSPNGLYLGLVLVWAGPVLALQWGFGGDLLASRWRLLVAVVVPATLYLGAVDRFAIHDGIWSISTSSSTGVHVLGLPLEEGVFFLVTNLMIAFGLGLVLDPRSPARLRGWRRRLARERAGRPRRGSPTRGQSGWRVVLLLWALSMVPIPLLGAASFVPLAYLSTGLLAVGATGMALERAGRRAWAAAGVALVFGWAVEWLGSRTGVPFGHYAYLAAGPELLGVPLLVPLGWWAFTAISLALGWRGARWAGAALAMVAWDAGLDPLMVERGLWRFDPAGAYFGVPLSNFLGWAVAGALVSAVVLRIAPGVGRAAVPEARAVYAGQAVFIGLGLALFGLPVAGAVAAAAMLTVTQIAARGSVRQLREDGARMLSAAIAVVIPAVIAVSLRRGLAGVWVRDEAALPRGGVVVVANHHSWWDGYLAFLLARRLGRPLTVLMDREQLARFPFFRAHGAIAAHEVRRALRRLEAGHLVVVFPEGRLRAAGAPGELAPGAAYLSRRSGCPVVPVALRVVLRGGERPEAFVRVGRALPPGSDPPDAEVERTLAAVVARLDADLGTTDPEAEPAGYGRWLRGRRSTHRRLAWGTGLWGRPT